MNFEWIAQATVLIGKPVPFPTTPCVSQHEPLWTHTHIVLGWKRGYQSSFTTDTAECAGQERYPKWFPLLSRISVFFYWLKLSTAIQSWKQRLTTINGNSLTRVLEIHLAHWSGKQCFQNNISVYRKAIFSRPDGYVFLHTPQTLL